MRSRVRIGLVLSGGGLRGAGHLGVLQRLVDHNVPIDVIVGSSAGAVVAAYYASVDVVRASASIPFLFPPIAVQCGDESLLLKDGGVSDCLPIEFARRPPSSATHLIVSDCRWFAGQAPPADERLIYIRPRLFTTGTLWASSTLLSAVHQGAAALTDEMLERISGWNCRPAEQPERSVS